MCEVFEFPSSDESVNEIESEVRQLLEKLGYNGDACHWTCVAVREAAVNAHKYGNKKDESKRIILRTEYTDKSVTIYIGDEGAEEFRIEDHFYLKKDLFLPDSRGVFFMRQFTDESPAVEYVLRDGSTTPHYPGNELVVGKRVKLVKYREPTSSR